MESDPKLKAALVLLCLVCFILDLARVRLATQCTIEKTERFWNKKNIYDGCRDNKKSVKSKAVDSNTWADF